MSAAVPFNEYLKLPEVHFPCVLKGNLDQKISRAWKVVTKSVGLPDIEPAFVTSLCPSCLPPLIVGNHIQNINQPTFSGYTCMWPLPFLIL